MDNSKEETLRKQRKYDRIEFAIDYIRTIISTTGEVNLDDFIAVMVKLDSNAYSDVQRDTLERQINQMYGELDEIVDEIDNHN